MLSVAVCGLGLIAPGPWAMADQRPLILEPEADRPISTDPVLVVPRPDRVLDDAHVALWVKAMSRPESGLRREVMTAAMRAADMGFVPQLEPLINPIAQRLTDDTTPAAERALAITALHALNASQLAEAVAAQLEDTHADVLLAADRALADWQPQQHTRAWIARAGSDEYLLSARRSAVRSLAGGELARVQPQLLALATTPSVPGPLRREAALRLGEAGGASLIEPAGRMGNGSPLDRHLAAWMLRGATQPAGIAILQGFARQSDLPSLQAVAAESLQAGGDAGLMPVATALRTSDAHRARLSVAASLADRPLTAGDVLGLADLLDDPTPDVRNAARTTLATRAAVTGSDLAAAQRDLIRLIQGATDNRWRLLEQAALLARDIDAKPAVDALMGQMLFPRLESRVAVLRALRALTDDAHMPRILQHAQQLAVLSEAAAERTEIDPLTFNRISGLGKQLSFLHEMLGEKRYAPAEPHLRRFIPKSSPFEDTARAAAIWALGHIHAGEPDAGLAATLAGRLSDLSIMDPEVEIVREHAALAIGRMNATAQRSTIKKFAAPGEGQTRVTAACRWAMEQLTGNPQPAPELEPVSVRGWFLEAAR